MPTFESSSEPYISEEEKKEVENKENENATEKRHCDSPEKRFDIDIKVINSQ